jgi:Putative heavy-metal-binding
MKIRKAMLLPIVAALALAPIGAAGAKKAAKQYQVVNTDVGVPVFATDLPDHPYTVVGEVEAKVRKATIFSKEASQEKIYLELWERAEKLGADAVVNANYGNSHVTAFSWGSTTAKGTAVKFTAGPNLIAPEPKKKK